MQCLWWATWLFWCGVRAALLPYWASLGPMGFAVGCSEGYALVCGVINGIWARERHYTFTALSVPGLYLAVFLSLPAWPDSGLFIVVPCFIWSVCMLAWALFYLGNRFSFAGTSWVSLLDRGPYAFIRHPQQSAWVLLSLGLGVACLVGGDWAGAGWSLFACVCSVVVAFAEEADLRRYPEWVLYSQRVRCRFIPGVV